jgi:23S rRNA pseudouridine2605 synthase
MKNNTRLQKYLSSCGIASRRKSEELIEHGLVKVNGNVITGMGFCVSDDDVVEYNGKIVKPSKKIYIILNKPPGFVCSRKDYLKRQTIYDIVDDNKNSIFSVGRLDFSSCGIIILTNDGDFANELAHPSGNIIKTYVVESTEIVPDVLIEEFKKGILIEGIKYKALDMKKISGKVCEIFLHEGKKREIREVYKHFNIKIKKLERVAIGKMNLESLKIKQGEFKYYTLDQLKGKIYG